MTTSPGATAGPADRWPLAVAAVASLVMSAPLAFKGTPDVESYRYSVFSTLAFARNLAQGADPWFVPEYGFGITLPDSTWLLKFPPALPASFLGAQWLYASIWVGGEFAFAWYFLRLVALVTPRRGMAVALLATALLSFSSLGHTYVDDWPEHFLGWALLPAVLWHAGRVVLGASRADRLRSGAACAFALVVFTGSVSQNEMVTLASGLAMPLAFLARTRAWGVLAVGGAMAVGLISASDVVLPTVAGFAHGHVDPLSRPIVTVRDELSVASYATFLAPFLGPAAPDPRAAVTSGGYARVPFFGLVALVLAGVGAVRPFVSRAPVGKLPNDVARAIGIGFLVHSALTLSPAWVVLGLPRMWMYRDGQAVFGLLCAAIALEASLPRFARAAPVALGLHLAQVGMVAAPIVFTVAAQPGTGPLFGYARHPHLFLDGLRRSGVGPSSRVMLAGDLESGIRGELAEAGITAGVDLPREGIALVNALYRGDVTPSLGQASIPGRYGAYEAEITWADNLRHLDAAGLDVLGITHVVAFEDESAGLGLPRDLVPAGRIAVPGGRRVSVLRNGDAWTRASLLAPGAAPPAPRPGCPTPTIYCLEFVPFAAQLRERLPLEGQGSSLRVRLPAGHAGGTLLFTVTAGPRPRATVDGEPRRVERFLGAFPAVEVRPGEREVALSVRRTGRMALSLMGMALMLGSLLVAVLPGRASKERS